MATLNSTLAPVEMLDAWMVAPILPTDGPALDAEVQRLIDDLNAVLFTDIEHWTPKH